MCKLCFCPNADRFGIKLYFIIFVLFYSVLSYRIGPDKIYRDAHILWEMLTQIASTLYKLLDAS